MLYLPLPPPHPVPLSELLAFLHLLKLTLDEYVLLVLETQADRDRQAQIQASLQAHMKNTEEINMNAKIRSNSRKPQSAFKTSRKRKAVTTTGEGEESPGEIETNSFSDSSNGNINQGNLLCSQPQQTIGLKGEEPRGNPAYPTSQCVPTERFQYTPTESLTCRGQENHVGNETPNSSFASQLQSTGEATARPAGITNNLSNLLPSLSPISRYPSSSYERTGPYIPSFHFNTAYSDYVNHSYGSSSSSSLPQPLYPAVDHAPQQHYSFHHPMSYNVAAAAAVNSAQQAPPSYWASTNYTAPISSDISYHHLSYAPRGFSSSYDIYKRDGLHQPYQDSGVENRGIIARPTPSYDHNGRPPAICYHTRQHDNFHLSSSLSSVSPYNATASFVHDQLHQLQAPPTSQSQPSVSCHLGRQDHAPSYLLHDDSFAATVGAGSGFSSFRKTYLPASFI
ncbi:DNA-binding protein RFX6-like [Elysia marginata]|uniref:DNA-binding protein RFX6-like n=1 Tax=Elysia marginata TaxID=1093978 RepID=A0AAV4JFM8_9GAST|nr:DNA-binding protein RFX6-like [Elysia marginata]